MFMWPFIKNKKWIQVARTSPFQNKTYPAYIKSARKLIKLGIYSLSLYYMNTDVESLFLFMHFNAYLKKSPFEP